MQHDSSRRPRSRSFCSAACIPAAVAALLALGACKSTDAGSTAGSTGGSSAAAAPNKVEISNEISAKAEVVAVDKATRAVTLRREDGAMLTIRCPADVRNFDQIAAGNELRVRYRQQLSVERSTGSVAEDAQVAAAAARAPKGAMPAAAVGAGLHVVVKIESIDAQRDIVVFSLPSGELVSHRIATADGRAFVRGLKIGDKVVLLYSEALAMSVEAM
jgi:hypothetical protein